MSDVASPEDSLSLSDKMAQLKTAFETLERNVSARKRGLEDGLKQVIRKKDQVPLSENSCMRYLHILSSYNVFAHLINPPRMHRRVAVVESVCVSVCLLLTSGASVRPENSVTYSTDNESQNICGVFPETAPLQRSSIPSIESHTYRHPFSYGKHACAL